MKSKTMKSQAMKPQTVMVGVLALGVALAAIACSRPSGFRGDCCPVVSRTVVQPAGSVQQGQPQVALAPVSDSDLSLLRGSVFGTPTPEAVKWTSSMPGSNERVPHLFEGAPPAVPHGIDDFLPITLEENGCLECHLSADEDPDEVPQLPDSHKTDLRVAPDRVGGEVAGSRYVCVLCHVPLSDAQPLPELAPDE